jgi:hypothetical protein
MICFLIELNSGAFLVQFELRCNYYEVMIGMSDS